MIDLVVLLVASVTLSGVAGVVAAPDFVPPAMASTAASTVTQAPQTDPFSAFRVDGNTTLRAQHERLDPTLLPQLAGRVLLEQLAMLDRAELSSFMETSSESTTQLLLNPPAAGQTARWWASLPTAAQRDLRAAAPEIVGNLPGVPIATRDAVNRELLETTIGQLEATAEMGIGRVASTEIGAQLSMLHQIELAIAPATGTPDRSIISLDTQWPGRAAIVVGDLGTADYVSYLIPGMFFTIEGQVVDWSETALELYNEQNAWLDLLGRSDPRLQDKTVATVAWMGYQTPNIFTVGSEELADEGALYLDSAMDSLFDERGTDRPFVSLLAHSYGSTAAMKALVTGNFEVDSFAVVGSPGSDAQSVDDLHVRGRNVFVGEASWDPVVGTGYFGNDPGAPSYGAHPMSVAGGVDLITDEELTASVGHNGYFAPNSESLRNMALIGIDRGSLVSDGSGQDVQRTLTYFNRLI
ncbi:alpha/beta hydrolase [Homoserinimonas sp. A447]